MNAKTIGEIVQGAGIVAVLVGLIAGFHHLAFSIPVAIGGVAYFVGSKIAAGKVAV